MLNNTPITETLKAPQEIAFQNKYVTLRLVPSRWGPYVSIQSGTGLGVVLVVVKNVGDESEILMVSQPRYALTTDGEEHNGFFTWEFPRGGNQPGETIEDTAHRELLEETNLVFATEDLFHLGTGYTDTGIFNSRIDYYTVEVKDPAAQNISYNDHELLQHRWVPVSELIKAMRNNDVQDAYTLVAFSKVLLHNKIVV